MPTPKRSYALGNSFYPDYGGGVDSKAGTSINIGGYKPDYANLIENDPGYLALKGALGAAGVQDAASRRAQVNRALTQFGFVPDFQKAGGSLGLLGEVQTDVDPLTPGLAQQSTEAGLSTKARIDKAYKDQVRELKNVLNARGLLRSGEAGYQLGEAQHGYETANYDATQKLLDYLAGVNQAWVQAQQGRNQQLVQGVQSATTNVMNSTPPPVAPTTLPWNPSVGGYGPDAEGNLYDQNGNKIGNVNQAQPSAGGPAVPRDVGAPVSRASGGGGGGRPFRLV